MRILSYGSKHTFFNIYNVVYKCIKKEKLEECSVLLFINVHIHTLTSTVLAHATFASRKKPNTILKGNKCLNYI